MKTINDVAKKANVSVATVSRVINNSSHKVNAKTREKVLKVIEELDFHPNEVAKSLQKRKTNTIGVLIPDISNPYYAEIVRGIQDFAEELGVSVFLQNTDRDSRKVIRDVYLLREKNVEGIVFSGGIITDDILNALGSLREKSLVIGRQKVDMPSIRIDNRGLTLRIVEYLVSSGYKKIGFLGGPETSITAEDRYQGYLEGIKKHNCLSCKEYALFGELTLESGYQKATRLLSHKELPTAIVTANDQIAFGAIKAIKDKGLKVPGDIAVTGFDNTPLTRYFEPTITTIHIPRYEMGRDAMKYLRVLIGGGVVKKVNYYECQLVVRDSTRQNSQAI